MRALSENVARERDYIPISVSTLTDESQNSSSPNIRIGLDEDQDDVIAANQRLTGG